MTYPATAAQLVEWAGRGRLVDYARTAGFDDINVDVVYGLPLQTEASFASTLDAVIDLAPDRIALFGYAHLPSKLPGDVLRARARRGRPARRSRDLRPLLVRNVCMVFDRYHCAATDAHAQPRFSPTI